MINVDAWTEYFSEASWCRNGRGLNKHNQNVCDNWSEDAQILVAMFSLQASRVLPRLGPIQAKLQPHAPTSLPVFPSL